MGEERAQRRNDSALLLAAGGNHRLSAGIHLRPLAGTKPTAHVLVDLGRAPVSFGLVVGERHTRHQGNGQDGVLGFPQTAEQIASWRAFWPPSALLGVRRRFLQRRPAQHLAIALLGLCGCCPLRGQRLRDISSKKGGIALAHAALPSIKPCNSRKMCALQAPCCACVNVSDARR